LGRPVGFLGKRCQTTAVLRYDLSLFAYCLSLKN
jgi:hypothetical protein